MALLLALSTNIGVGGMVEGFRKTFLGWLDQRLIAEIYFEAATPRDAREIDEWARAQRDIAAILPVWRAKTRLGGWPVDLVGMSPHETYAAHFPLIEAAPNVWRALHEEDAALVSEQLARRLGLAVGAMLDVPTSVENWRARIAGIFPDYGNPKGQLRIDHDRLVRHFADASGVHYSLRVAPEAAPRVMADMQARFGAKIARIVDQAEVKKLSTDIFERTFAVTAALNTLTLIVSGIALFASLLTLSDMRRARIAPVWAAGITRRRLAALELARVLMFAAGDRRARHSAWPVHDLAPRRRRQCRGFRLAPALPYVSGAMGAGFRHGARRRLCRGARSCRKARAHGARGAIEGLLE